ncbi:MAG: LysM peptidoglycan-binding domain-containing M23 family metallopeptidase [Nitrospinaceae bacterium]
MSGRILRWPLAALLGLSLWGCQGFEYARPHPDRPGVYHTVGPGQTLWAIAKTYGSDLKRLQVVNGIPDPASIQAGRRIWIPNAYRVLEVPGQESPAVRTAQPAKPRPSGNVSPARPPRVAALRPGRLIWPLRGRLTSPFGRRWGRNHEGIDIGAKAGTPIRAAAAGEIKFSGWGPTGYGKMIIIKHPNKLTTVYAHNSRNLVHPGRRVARGQVIGLVGSTGRSTGPHLHFEVRNHTKPKDPLKFLPKK